MEAICFATFERVRFVCKSPNKQRFEEEEAKFYVSEVLIALAYLHGVNVVYRDLKPEV